MSRNSCLRPWLCLVAIASWSCGGGGTEPKPGPNPGQNPPPSTGPTGSYESTIAFVSERDGNAEIYIIDPAGEHRVTNDPAKDANPVWSPDGSRIAFERNGALWAIGVDGTNTVKLTNPPSGALDVRQNDIPISSSDGRLLYTRYSSTSVTIRIVNFDGTNDRELATGNLPTWSGDGSLIAFDNTVNGASDVMLIQNDGTQLRDLTNSSNAHEDWPVMSRDGKYVAFSSSVDGFVIMRTDGTTRTVTGHSTNVYRWSPDATRLAFREPRSGTASSFDLDVINVDGTGVRRLTNKDFFVGYAAWSPDGTRIAFDNGPFSSGHVYVAKADGSSLMQLTPSGSTDYEAAWKP
jgi:TolB protein